MFLYYYDWTYFMILLMLLLSLWAQHKVKSNYRKYSQVMSRRGYSGADIARSLLAFNGIKDVQVEMTRGYLTDHYDPRRKVLRLSEEVYSTSSISAISIAAHETGHAVQHSVGYAPLSIRNSIVPAVNIGSQMAFPLFFLGLIFGGGYGDFGYMLMQIGFILFAGVVIFQLITLPIEFNASSRAIAMLERNNYLGTDEIQPAKKVLNAAALTYVAAAASAIMNLVRLLALSGRRRR